MDIIALVGLIVVIGIVCALLDVPAPFQKLLYVICAILVIVIVLSLFGIGFNSNLHLK